MKLRVSVFRRCCATLSVLAICASTAPAAPPPWSGVQIIEYQERTPAQWATLRGIGVTAGKVLGQRQGDVEEVAGRDAALRVAGLGCYVENIATDFYSAYHRWTPDRPVNWLFTQAQRAYRANPSSLAPLVRTPSLSDPAWLARISDRLAEHVRVMRGFHPLFYDLADEPGIADLAAFWDFDFSPMSLAAFRLWLRQQYGSLATLNAEWGTHETNWEAVRPWTTRQAMAEPEGNLAPWADFKAFMDVAFSRAVQAGTDALHRADPTARAALEGAQVPGWGGYDYSLLSKAVDVMEVYDEDENMALLRAFNPDALPVITTFSADNSGRHQLWVAWLHGARAVVLWDQDQQVVLPDARLGPRGKAYQPIFAALRGRPGQVLSASKPVYDQVAILYSPASFRIEWMIENRPHGDAWMNGGSEADARGVTTRTALTAYAERLAHLGLRPRYITDAQLAAGLPKGVRLLVLPHAVALSDAELAALRAFQRGGGEIVTDAAFGLTDLHGRARAHAPDNVRAVRVAPNDKEGLASALSAANLTPLFRTDVADAKVYVFRSRRHWLVGVQRDSGADNTLEMVTANLPERMRGTNLLTGTAIPESRVIRVQLDRVTPALFDLVPSGSGSG